MSEMRFIRDDPLAPRLVITDQKAFLDGLAEANAAMDEAIAEAERREVWFPVLRLVRECRATHIRVRRLMYERRRDAAQAARIERRLEGMRMTRAQRQGRADAAAGRPLDRRLSETASQAVFECYRLGYDFYLREGGRRERERRRQ